MDRSKAYEILGLPENAGEDEIKNAYRALAQKYNVEHYEAGPLRQEAEQHMTEINEAFDALMSLLRTGRTDLPESAAAPENAGRYPAIRQMINEGQVDEALAELQAIPGGANDAEWNFLMGSAYYYKGWLGQALAYFQRAAQLDPSNREYQAALQNLQGAAEGDMQGNPYVNPDPGGAAINCACNSCAMMCCMDALCGICRGF